MVMLDGSKEDCLMLVCAHLREVARAGAPTRARLALLGDALGRRFCRETSQST